MKTGQMWEICAWALPRGTTTHHSRRLGYKLGTCICENETVSSPNMPQCIENIHAPLLATLLHKERLAFVLVRRLPSPHSPHKLLVRRRRDVVPLLHPLDLLCRLVPPSLVKGGKEELGRRRGAVDARDVRGGGFGPGEGVDESLEGGVAWREELDGGPALGDLGEGEVGGEGVRGWGETTPPVRARQFSARIEWEWSGVRT